MSALPTVAGESFNSKFTAKTDFSIGYFTIADTDIGSLSLSIHYLISIWNHMLVKFEQNRMVRTLQNFELFDKKWTIFDKVLTPFWETFLWLKQ